MLGDEGGLKKWAAAGEGQLKKNKNKHLERVMMMKMLLKDNYISRREGYI